jgi:hypothetical protein
MFPGLRRAGAAIPIGRLTQRSNQTLVVLLEHAETDLVGIFLAKTAIQRRPGHHTAYRDFDCVARKLCEHFAQADGLWAM